MEDNIALLQIWLLILAFSIGVLCGCFLCMWTYIRVFRAWTIARLAKHDVNIEFICNCLGKEKPIK